VVTGTIALAEFGRGNPDPQPELLLDRRLLGRPSPTFLPPLWQRAQRLLHQVDRHPGLYLPRAAGIALAALIAYQCATLYGVIVTPPEGGRQQAVRPAPPQPATMLASFDPFFPAAAAAVAPIQATDLTLHGLRHNPRTGGGSAIISQSDGAQRSFGIGEEIAPGVVLKLVGFDHVLVIRHGMDERLALKVFASTGPASTPTVRSVRSPYTLTPAASPTLDVRPKQPAPRGSALPARSIDFADPSTLPASLSGPIVPNRR
jgi:general secretion pathway protein C